MGNSSVKALFVKKLDPLQDPLETQTGQPSAISEVHTQMTKEQTDDIRLACPWMYQQKNRAQALGTQTEHPSTLFNNADMKRADG